MHGSSLALWTKSSPSNSVLVPDFRAAGKKYANIGAPRNGAALRLYQAQGTATTIA